jgi:hypothetical protein
MDEHGFAIKLKDEIRANHFFPKIPFRGIFGMPTVKELEYRLHAFVGEAITDFMV